MRITRALAILSLMTIPSIYATKPHPTITVDEIAGKWLGYTGYGQLVVLRIDEETSGSLSIVEPVHGAPHSYSLTGLDLQRAQLKLSFVDSDGDAVQAKGIARTDGIGLRIKGLLGRPVDITFLRPDAWRLALLQLDLEPELQDCDIVNSWSLMEDWEKELHQVANEALGKEDDTGWLKSVRRCEAGRLTVWMPADGESSNVQVMDEDGVSVTYLDDHLMVTDGGRRIIASFWDEDRDGTVDRTAYSLLPEPSDGFYEIWDLNADGCPEMKYRRGEDGKSHHFANLVGRWGEVVKRDGVYGYLINDRWYETSDAYGEAILRSLEACERALAEPPHQ